MDNNQISNEHRTTKRIFEALEIIAGTNGGITLSALARACNIPKGSLFPLLNTLTQSGYLKCGEQSKKYTIGPKLFVLGRTYVNPNSLLDNISNEIRELAGQVHETVYFSVLDKGDTLYLSMSDVFTKLKIVSVTGRKMPAYATANGKAILSYLSEEELKNLYPNGLQSVTPRTITNMDDLLLELNQAKETGFSYEVEESTPYIRCVGVPILHGDRCIAGLSVATPVMRYSLEKEKLIKSSLLETKMIIENIVANDFANWVF